MINQADERFGNKKKLTFTDHLRFEIANENLLWKQKFAQYRGMK